ncbi:hypothetical protein J0A78_02620 [Providencia rettgeri]|nr:hypothetical protein [Providencia rettgeri]MBN7852830.1 hypothetical protein [Providencia rettgeri]MBN7864633.1 hypothetical protein [Providencia rettgeri]MBN7874698.1 hypothetical protein [Providencia rettgeri]MBN7895766.1 hypothetical protein [Providencia rettgeri]
MAKVKCMYCSFCGKDNTEVSKLIAGPSVYICDECISLCNQIIDEESQERSIEKKNPLAAKILQLITSCMSPILAHPIIISDELLLNKFDTDESQLTKAISFLKKNNKISITPVMSGVNIYMTNSQSIDITHSKDSRVKRIRADILVDEKTVIKF